MAETGPDPLRRLLEDGIIPQEEITRTENHWVFIMVGMLAVMMAIIVVTGVAGALHPPSNVETINATSLHLGGEFAESNLGSAIEPDGSVTARLIAQQYSFVPDCVLLPAGIPVKFRITSADVIHGFILPDTNVNTMVVPGFVAEVRTTFNRPADYTMPCHEFCGAGHQGMWAHVRVVPKEQFPNLALLERTSCAR
ncbi:MAG: cytochrome C oxidase subunit II [Rhodomicrobium sp.]